MIRDCPQQQSHANTQEGKTENVPPGSASGSASQANNETQQRTAQAATTTGILRNSSSTQRQRNGVTFTTVTEIVLNGYSESPEDLHMKILLDNQSTTDIFRNFDLLQNIREVAEELHLFSNGGKIITKLMGYLDGYGDVWYHPEAIANIISQTRAEDRGFKIDYETGKGYSMYSPFSKKTHWFPRTQTGLFAMDLKNQEISLYQAQECNHVMVVQDSSAANTVKERMSYYSKKQQARAQIARRLYETIGFMSPADFKLVVQSNALANCPVTVEDIKIAEDIYGPSVFAIKGKSVRVPPHRSVSNTIEIPRELIAQHRGVQLCADIVFIEELPFLITLSKNIRFGTITYVHDLEATKTLWNELKKVWVIYAKAGFRIKQFSADQQFECLSDEIALTGCEPNILAAKSHQPDIERFNRTFKERFRSTYHSLPYGRWPKIMIIRCASEVMKWLNTFPPKGGISAYYSPRAIILNKGVDYKIHCQHQFGAYVQAHTDNPKTNTMHERAIDSVYMGTLDTDQGGYRCLNLATGKEITRHHLTELPITKDVIRRVEALAGKDGYKKHKTPIIKLYHQDYLDALSAGVDDDSYDSDESEDESEDDDEPPELQSRDDFILLDDNCPDDTFSDRQRFDLYDSDSEDEDVPPQLVPREPDDYSSDSDDDDDDDYGIGQTILDDDDDDEIIPTSEEEELPVFPGFGIPMTPRMTNEPTETEQDLDIEESAVPPEPRRSGRAPQPRDILTASKLGELHVNYGHTFAQEIESNLITQVDPEETLEYEGDEIPVFAAIFEMIFVQQLSLKQAIEKWGDDAVEAAIKEVKQLHDRESFRPIDVSTLTPEQRRKVMRSFIFLVQKRNGVIKARKVTDGSIQRTWITKEEAGSPTAHTESLIITGVIDAKENRCVATVDLPNAFLTCENEKLKPHHEEDIMKVQGQLALMLCEIAPHIYKPFLIFERGQPTLYCIITKALYGMIKSPLLLYRRMRRDMEAEGFTINPYDICVATKMVNGSQLTLLWHVDDIKISHKDEQVVEDTINWFRDIYEDPEITPMKPSRGKEHDFTAIMLDYNTPGVFAIHMKDFLRKLVTEFKFPGELAKIRVPTTPAAEHLFNVDPNKPVLDKERKEEFHTITAKSLFVSNRTRPDLNPTVPFLCTRTKNPSEDDWKKMLRMLKYVEATIELELRLQADEGEILICKWYPDAAFAVHADMKSHTGGVFTLGKGSLKTISAKQKLNTRSSTEAEIVAVDDVLTQAIWSQNFINALGYSTKTIMHQDNTSSMLLEKNGMESVGKRSRHINIRYFLIKDYHDREEVHLEYCPTDDMPGDYPSKPLQGRNFFKQRKFIMNHELPRSNTSDDDSQQQDNRSVLGDESVTKKSHKTRVYDVSTPIEVEEAFTLVEREDGELLGEWSLLQVASNGNLVVIEQAPGFETSECAFVTCIKKDSACKARPTAGRTTDSDNRVQMA